MFKKNDICVGTVVRIDPTLTCLEDGCYDGQIEGSWKWGPKTRLKEAAKRGKHWTDHPDRVDISTEMTGKVLSVINTCGSVIVQFGDEKIRLEKAFLVRADR